MISFFSNRSSPFEKDRNKICIAIVSHI